MMNLYAKSFLTKKGKGLETFNFKNLMEKDTFWDEIASIEYAGEEHVYDIEVEGTHNFIANDIIAHNTYLKGRVGIGTGIPVHALEVAGSMNVSGDLNVSGTLIAKLGMDEVRGNNLSIVGTRNSSIDGSTFYVDSTNNYVGIGTTGPGRILEVNSGSAYQNARFFSNHATFTEIYVGNTEASDDTFVMGFNKASDYGYLSVYGDDNSLVIANGGNLGIGTTSPSKKLVVNGTTEGIMFEPNVASPVINTTTSASNSNITITSSAGSVIIRLG